MGAPSFREALAFWHKLGWISFGGVAGQIAIMQAELVDRRRWIDQREFLQALNFCTLLPGPEAQQLATYCGWRLHGWRGGAAAGLLFIGPGALIMWAAAWLLAARGDVATIIALLSGIKPVVVAIIAAALWRMAGKALGHVAAWVLAVAAFAALVWLDAPFPLVVLVAGLVGFVLPAFAPKQAPPAAPPPHRLGRLAGLVALFVGLWAVPVGAVLLAFGTQPFADIARLFTTAAFVTFGGAYAVLPYVADAAVNDYAWLSTAQMVDGLALAETRPGPTILVLQYVGFLAGWAGSSAPLLTATVAAALTTYVTFLPSFLFIFAGAPYVVWLGSVRRLGGALAAITAAVVGVIASLGVFVADAVLLPQGRPDGVALVLAIIAFVALWRFKVAVHWLVVAGAVVGVFRLLAFGAP